MTNLVLEIQQGGHCKSDMFSDSVPTSYMEWLFDQVKGVPCTASPTVTTEGTPADYDWAGVQVLSSVEGWAEANPYSSWTEPADNATWDQVMAGANACLLYTSKPENSLILFRSAGRSRPASVSI